MDKDQLRLLPSVDELLQTAVGQELIARYSRPLTLEIVRERLSFARQAILAGEPCPGSEELLEWTERALKSKVEPHLRLVINATGVIIHTNLGRAPLSQD